MINQQEAIRRTRERTKRSKLSPFLGDAAEGIQEFNYSTADNSSSADVSGIGESLASSSLTLQLFEAIQEFYEEHGILEDYDLVDIDMESEGGYTEITISTNLQPDYLSKLEKYLLETVLYKIDKDLYFDTDGNGTLTTRVLEPQTLTEAIQNADKRAWLKNGKQYQLEEQYNLIKESLSSEDKRALQQFIENTDDARQIEIYLKGLVHKNDR